MCNFPTVWQKISLRETGAIKFAPNGHRPFGASRLSLRPALIPTQCVGMNTLSAQSVFRHAHVAAKNDPNSSPPWRRTIGIVFRRDMCVAKNTLRGESVHSHALRGNERGSQREPACSKWAMPIWSKFYRSGFPERNFLPNSWKVAQKISLLFVSQTHLTRLAIPVIIDTGNIPNISQ